MRCLLVGALVIAGTISFCDLSFAHGGQYRGPGDVVPPGGGSAPGGPRTPSRPGGPSTPSTPSGPATPSTPNGPATPTGPSGSGATAPATRRGVNLTPSLDTWTFWWEFNRERFLNLKSKIHSVPPATESPEFYVGLDKSGAKDKIGISRATVRDKILPVLRKVLNRREQDNRSTDEVSSALIALGKLGVEPAQTIEDISRFLDDKNQEIRETAAISIGILADFKGADVLTSLLEDSPKGRALVGEREVDLRTRAFSAHGLGLIGRKLRGEGFAPQRKRIINTLLAVLQADKSPIKDIKIACISALGLIEHEAGQAARITEVLLPILNDTRTKNIDLIRAHVPTAVARMGGVEHTHPFLKLLKNKREDQFVRQSLVLSMGVLGPKMDKKLREHVVDVVMRLADDGRSAQEKYFTGVVLGQLGTEKAIDFLLQQLRKGRKIYRPWAALGLGVHGFELPDGKALRSDIPLAVHNALVEEKNPDYEGAFSVSLGLLRALGSKDLLMKRFKRARVEVTKGYYAVGLGLMKASDAIELLRYEVGRSVRKHKQLQQIAIGLGLMGDKDIVPRLLEVLKDARATSVYAAASQALGFIGDARSVDPLLRLTDDLDGLSGEARAFAIVALGIVGDIDKLPWNTKIGENINYRAAVTTLTGGSVGVLDIL